MARVARAPGEAEARCPGRAAAGRADRAAGARGRACALQRRWSAGGAGRRSGPARPERRRLTARSNRAASVAASSKAWPAPCPRSGVIACAASPSSAIRPDGQRRQRAHQLGGLHDVDLVRRGWPRSAPATHGCQSARRSRSQRAGPWAPRARSAGRGARSRTSRRCRRPSACSRSARRCAGPAARRVPSSMPGGVGAMARAAYSPEPRSPGKAGKSAARSRLCAPSARSPRRTGRPVDLAPPSVDLAAGPDQPPGAQQRRAHGVRQQAVQPAPRHHDQRRTGAPASAAWSVVSSGRPCRSRKHAGARRRSARSRSGRAEAEGVQGLHAVGHDPDAGPGLPRLRPRVPAR